ncbi:MAG: DUF5011 domain-containing protein [Desulfobulbaceae bacterium]|nr:DUF5011 domain-containing protein [Desulfobulbaceae bacterium]
MKKYLTLILTTFSIGIPAQSLADGCNCIQVLAPVCGYMNECEALCHGVNTSSCPPPQTYTVDINSSTSSIQTSGGFSGSGFGSLQVQGSFQVTVFGEQLSYSNISVTTTPPSSFVFPSYLGSYQTLTNTFSGTQATSPNGTYNTFGGQFTPTAGNAQLTMQGVFREPLYDGYVYNFSINATEHQANPPPESIATTNGDVLDAPHNSAFGISCGSCHSYSLWWQFSPLSQIDTSHADRTRAICLTCHGPNGNTLPAQIHASAVPSWGADCMACHDAHAQAQLDWRGTVPNTDLYLATGTISSIQNDTVNGLSTLNYTIASTASGWTDPATWSSKNGPGRGLVLVVDTSQAIKTFQITAANSTSVTIKGLCDTSLGGKSFGLIYGQQINSSIATPNGPREVKFFNPKGNFGFVNFEAPASGVCQVCHANTLSWNSSGGGNNPVHASGLNCVSCHTMAQGFTAQAVNPVITLIGFTTVTVEAGTTYTDAGATAQDQFGADLTSAIVITHPADTAALGTYTVAYNVQDFYGNSAVQVSRTVNVVDTTPPIISLIGDANETVECATTYTDPGAAVTDNASIGLTATTTGTVNTINVGTVSTLYYNAQDDSGNSANAVTREVTVQDTTQPTIRLTGGSTVYVPVDGIYTESGAVASDSCGVSDTVQINGTVDTSTAGTYTLTYDVFDNAGNAANQVTRTVEVRAEDACAGHPSIAGPLSNAVLLSSSAFPDMQIVLSTKDTAYAGTMACIPVFVQMTNAGGAPINLNANQATSLSNMTIGLYRSSRIFNENLVSPSGQAIQPGLFLLPGESTYFSTQFSRERLELYTAPPLGGGVAQTNYSIQGPSGANGIVGVSLRNFTDTVDFGLMPSIRAFELGADTDFVAGELLVKFKNGVTISQAEAIIRQTDSHIKSNISNYSGYLLSVSIPFDKTTAQMMSTFSGFLSVEYSERNWIGQLH